jgi:integrase
MRVDRRSQHEPIPPLQERIQPTLVQKRPGRWFARFRWKGQKKERALGIKVEPSPKGEPPPNRVEKLALRKFTRPYLAGDWSPFEDDLYGPQSGPQRGPTVLEAKVRFLDRYDKNSSTRRNYESVIRLFEASLEPHTLLSEVVAESVRDFVYRKTSLVELKDGTTSDRPVSRSTQKHSHRHLRAFFNWARKERLIDENPVDRVDQPRVEVKAKPFVPPADISRIIMACDDRIEPELAAAYRVALGAGLRRSELLHLQARDVDLDYGHVLIRSKKMDQAEGGEWRPKGRRDRRVPINDLARDALVDRLDAVATPHDLLFSIDGDLVREERLTNVLRGVLDNLDIHLPRPLHALRGLFVTYHLLLDWPVPIVQALAGHRDSTVTLGYWRDASTLLWGDSRQRFREAAVELGFEPYDGAAVRL